MKKLSLTITIILGLAIGAAAQSGGGLFQRGAVSDEIYYGYGSYAYKTGKVSPGFPNHGQTDNQNAPLGSGIAVLATLGAAYAFSKSHRRKKG